MNSVKAAEDLPVFVMGPEHSGETSFKENKKIKKRKRLCVETALKEIKKKIKRAKYHALSLSS